MPVLIDGNNLLFAARDADPERPPSRSTLCLRLAEWARRTGEKITVVFDGPAPGGGLARQIGSGPVAVCYSGPGRSADELLAHILESDSAARRLLVVSSDREVGRAARRRRARTVRSDAFWRLLLRQLSRRAPAAREPEAKRRGLDSGQVERWLREMGLERDPAGEEADGE